MLWRRIARVAAWARAAPGRAWARRDGLPKRRYRFWVPRGTCARPAPSWQVAERPARKAGSEHAEQALKSAPEHAAPRPPERERRSPGLGWAEQAKPVPVSERRPEPRPQPELALPPPARPAPPLPERAPSQEHSPSPRWASRCAELRPRGPAKPAAEQEAERAPRPRALARAPPAPAPAQERTRGARALRAVVVARAALHDARAARRARPPLARAVRKRQAHALPRDASLRWDGYAPPPRRWSDEGSPGLPPRP